MVKFYLSTGDHMTLNDCYTLMGGNYQEAKSRLMNDKLVERFIQKFLQDTSFQELEKAMEAKDGETAFRCAHTLKGVSANLSLSLLASSSSLLTEELRNKGGVIPEEAYRLFEEVKKDYSLTTETIKSYFA